MDQLLLETGDALLLETGDDLLLESAGGSGGVVPVIMKSYRQRRVS